MVVGTASAAPVRSRALVVTGLGITQTLAWASSYYLPAILADPIATELGCGRSLIFAAFSASLLISAVLGPMVGRAIDRHGGRGVLLLSNLVLATGLGALALVHNLPALFGVWIVLGIGMALGLYDSAFATLAALYGNTARGPITGITLFAGFASTVGWPVSAALSDAIGWRGTCLVWAALHLLLGLPLNRLLLPKAPPREHHAEAAAFDPWSPRREMLLLAYVFAAVWFVTGAMAAHLPALLERSGASNLQAIAASALVGPAQVAARMVEFALLSRVHPVVSARLATLLHPLGVACIALVGAPAAAAFALLHGAGNGLLTIARGTLPLAVFGPVGYGTRNGLLGAPARAAQALAPFLFGLLLDRFGTGVLMISTALTLSALAVLLAFPARATAET